MMMIIYIYKSTLASSTYSPGLFGSTCHTTEFLTSGPGRLGVSANDSLEDHPKDRIPADN